MVEKGLDGLFFSGGSGRKVNTVHLLSLGRLPMVSGKGMGEEISADQLLVGGFLFRLAFALHDPRTLLL